MKRVGMGSFRGAVVIIALVIALLTGIVAGTDTSMEFDRFAPMNAVVAKPVVVTVTPLPCPPSSDYSCMEESRAKVAWGSGGYELWTNHPCGYTESSAPKYCYRKATVTSGVGLALVNRYVPAVTTTPGRDVAMVAPVQRYKPQAEKASPDTGWVVDREAMAKHGIAAGAGNTTEGPWITGYVSNGGIVTCNMSAGMTRFSGDAGGNAENMTVTLKIFDVPYSPVMNLPADGVIIGSTRIKDGRSWEFAWDQSVPGNSLTPDQEYYIKAMLSDTNYLKFGILYNCTSPARLPLANQVIPAQGDQVPAAAGLQSGTGQPAGGAEVQPFDSASRVVQKLPDAEVPPVRTNIRIVDSFIEVIVGGIFGRPAGNGPSSGNQTVIVSGPQQGPGGSGNGIAPVIGKGGTIYIGEEGLDVGPALNAAAGSPTGGIPPYTKIGSWIPETDLHYTQATKIIDLGSRYSNLMVTPSDFVGYTGDWYLIDPSTGYGKSDNRVFRVEDPRIDIRIRNMDDVAGKSVKRGDLLSFLIESNMGYVLDGTRSPLHASRQDGFIDIKVQDPSGKLLNSLEVQDSSNPPRQWTEPLQQSCWDKGPGAWYFCEQQQHFKWNTSAVDSSGQPVYPAGIYTVWAESRLNHMIDNFKNAGANYEGHTITKKYTFTLTDSCSGKCPAGRECDNGWCVLPCPTPPPGISYTHCSNDGACIDIASDNNNCGTCGRQCPAGENCVQGRCESSVTTICGSGLTKCKGFCVDIQTDSSNCGGCGYNCIGYPLGATSCQDGTCQCPRGWTLCGGETCNNLMTDGNHCGSCGNNCALGQHCFNGQCGSDPALEVCLYPDTSCSGKCVDTMTDVSNCGGCGVRCGARQLCANGKCK